METFDLLMQGFSTAATPINLLYAFIGVLLGTAVGVLPGIGPAMAVALLLPVTYSLEPTSAFIMFAGIYYGGMYGGSTTSILLNTPGESSTVITAIEGHKMAKSGRAAQALATAAIGSFVAGTIGTALLVACAPVVVDFAVSLGDPSYLAIIVLALIAVTAVLGGSKLRGFSALGIGLAIGLVGADPVTGQQRLIFGQPLLVDGLDIVVVAVAIFAVGEALWIAAHLRRKPMQTIPVGRPWMGKQDWKRSWKPWLRGTAYGFPFGALPAGGAEIPTFLSYVTEKKLSKHPEEFGHGAIEGVAGPEAANNASAAGTLTPLLALGLPTNATAAVMLAAFIQFGIQPGPLLFDSEPQLVWALIASLFIGNTLLLLINLPLAPVWAKLLQLPRPYLYAGILFFATLGAYAVNLQAFDLVILLLLGLLGFAMRRYGMPVLPLVIGLILGPRAEESLRTTLQLSAGDISGLWSEPVAVVVYIIVALVLLAPLALKIIRKRRPESVLLGNVPQTPDETAATDDDGGVANGYANGDNDSDHDKEHDKDTGSALPEHAGSSGGDPAEPAGRHRSDKIQNERERS
ncbi:tripartite tricarboxylate transporter permease [Arthrobacter sp. VKM Ac-2550]|uniref:tripartite tricarboxylate transporter permease n=1 Tax=Crystallibacter permensis TaxID=1938888 RepID=UPI0022279AA7|nr:tripartite tricarboxylate transporter permease [Arthrobacter sp. VKM Ac-2550]MCW2134630.1 putative tricarboxylic transport membrane protein [Arthrobacter sp. VKM Ac-2550]